MLNEAVQLLVAATPPQLTLRLDHAANKLTETIGHYICLCNRMVSCCSAKFLETGESPMILRLLILAF